MRIESVGLSGYLKPLRDKTCPVVTAFHNYQMTWTADVIVFGVDDHNYFEFMKPNPDTYSAWPFDRPQYMILNLAIGGDPGGPVDDTIFPVKKWKLNTSGFTNKIGRE